MSEVNSGVSALLANPFFYDLFQGIVGANAWRRKVVEAATAPALDALNGKVRILDIGCGSGDVLSYLPESVEYIGFDRNPAYIKSAMDRYRDRNARFVCDELTAEYVSLESGFDIVMALGVLHHLDDETAESLFRVASKCLNPSGILLTLDPLYAAGQSRIARYLISKDRGRKVRTETEYRRLAQTVFSKVKCHEDRDPLRIPYTGITMICRP